MYTYNSIHVVLQVAKSFDSRNLNYTRSVLPTNLYTHIVQRVFSCFIESKLPHSNSQAPSSKLHAFAIYFHKPVVYIQEEDPRKLFRRCHALTSKSPFAFSLSLSLSFSRIRWISVEFRLIRFAHTHSILVYVQNIESLGFTLN